MESTQTYPIYDELFDETFTANIQKNGTEWIGSIPDVPEIACKGHTIEEVKETLPKQLHKTLVAQEKAWQKQFEEDVQSGKLVHLKNRAVENYKAGRYYKIILENE